MRHWFLKHPNVAWAGLAVLWLFTVHAMFDYFDDRRWGWFAVMALSSLGWYHECGKWWKRT